MIIDNIVFSKIADYIFSNENLILKLKNSEKLKIFFPILKNSILIKIIYQKLKKLNLLDKTIILALQPNYQKLYFLRKELINYPNIFIDMKNISKSLIDFSNDFDLAISFNILKNELKDNEWVISNIYDSLSINSYIYFIENIKFLKYKDNLISQLKNFNFININIKKLFNNIIISANKKV